MTLTTKDEIDELIDYFRQVSELNIKLIATLSLYERKNK